MHDLVELLRIAVALGLVAAPPIIIARLIAGPDRASLADLLAFTTELTRPRGVQEEDVPRWQVERVRPHVRPSAEASPAEAAAAGCRPDRPVHVSRAVS
jgi:hypothetical protein